ncbi:hypothetical protein F4604DRAFT_258742 [Suillus subluteus]|nr:hypothetical protein F4604DRAFT_258742 [Suillus subluteus]
MIIFDFGFAVASSTVVIYNWILTSGQEFELIWSQPWSLITVLYLGVRCLGVIYCSTIILWRVPTVSVNDAVGNILWRLHTWTPVVTIVTLGVIMTIRIYAMYERSRKILIFLAVILLTLSITTGVLLAIVESHDRSEKLILSGIYQCTTYSTEANTPLLIGMDWEYVTGLIWEVLALSFAVWIVIKHFRELQRQSRWNIKDCFTVLIKTHVLYFAAFAVMSFFAFGNLSNNLSNLSSVGVQIYDGITQIVYAVQLFVLGPRLILSIRAHHAWLLADSDEGTVMTTIAFQEGMHELTDSDV